MNKKLTAITLATIIIMVIGNLTFVYADSKEDLKEIEEQRKDIQEDLSDAQSQVNDILSEMEELNKKIDEVNQSINENENLIEQTDESIANTLDEVRRLQEEIKKLEEDIEKRYAILEDRIISYQKNGGSVGFLEVILGSESFADLISRIVSVNKITQSDITLMEQLETDIRKVEENQQLAFEKLDELNELRNKQEETLQLVNDQKQQLEQDSQTLAQKQEELSLFIASLEEEDSKLASLEADVKHKIELARQEALEQKKREEERKAREKVKLADSNNDSLTTVGEKTVTMTSTAYTANCTGCSGITSTGIDLRANPDIKVIAVDPTVIPLGSVVHVEGYGYAIAGDTGSAIKGNKIDVFVKSKNEAIKWGIRKVKVTVQ